LLPTELPQVGKLRFAWRYRPCDELGGDLLNVVPIGDGAAAMYLADVSGHGVSAALVSVSVHRSLSVRGDRSSLILLHGESPNEVSATPPDQVAARLNALYPMESNGDHFFTLAYATVDAGSLEFTYCAAGHPGPIVVRAGTETQALESTAPPIGVVAYSKYRSNSIQLQAGDRVYLYSDGLDEAMSPTRELFGQDRIQTAIDQTGAMSLDESLDALLDAAVAWQGSEGFSDDVSLLALEVPGDSGAGG
jgi:sigma-B regulation protein RsbU (phosphoserine phosphatase)